MPLGCVVGLGGFAVGQWEGMIGLLKIRQIHLLAGFLEH